MPDPLKEICEAAANNDIETAKAIIAANSDLLKPDPKPNPAEGEAAPYKGLDVGDSPLMRAVKAGHSDMVKLLLEHGADPDEHHGYNYGMPAQLAIHKSHFEIVHLLLDYGADPTKSTAMGDMEVTGYSLFCGNNDLINRLYVMGGRADIFGYVKGNMIPVIAELLEHCPDAPLNRRSAGNPTILVAIRGEAAWCGNADALGLALAVRPITEAQFKNHIGATIKSHNRLFPVESYLRCMEMLFDAGAEYVGDENFLPLHQLAKKKRIEGRVEFARLFVKRGVDVNKVDPQKGQTAIEKAIEHERDDLVDFLKSL